MEGLVARGQPTWILLLVELEVLTHSSVENATLFRLQLEVGALSWYLSLIDVALYSQGYCETALLAEIAQM